MNDLPAGPAALLIVRLAVRDGVPHALHLPQREMQIALRYLYLGYAQREVVHSPSSTRRSQTICLPMPSWRATSAYDMPSLRSLRAAAAFLCHVARFIWCAYFAFVPSCVPHEQVNGYLRFAKQGLQFSDLRIDFRVEARDERQVLQAAAHDGVATAHRAAPVLI